MERLLLRLFRTGGLQWFPTHPDERDALLALAACELDRRRPYAEREVNEALLAWLTSVRAAPDHVTLRRRWSTADSSSERRAGRATS